MRSLDKEETVRKAVITTLASAMLRSPAAVISQWATAIGKRVLDKKVGPYLHPLYPFLLFLFFFRKVFVKRHVKG